MQKGKIRNFPQYTHFACLPFIQESHRNIIKSLQIAIRDIIASQYQLEDFDESNYLLSHVTISMLVLHREQTRKLIMDILHKIEGQIKGILKDAVITFKKTSYFTRINPKTKKNEVTLIYLEIQKDEHFVKIEKVTDLFIRQMLASEIITPAELKQMRIRYDHASSLYKSEQNHLTLFRVNNVPVDEKFDKVYQAINQIDKLKSFQCLSFDISTRKSYSENNFYAPFLTIPLKDDQKQKQEKIDIQEQNSSKGQ